MARPLETAASLVPDRPTLGSLQEAAAGCTACPLHARAAFVADLRALAHALHP